MKMIKRYNLLFKDIDKFTFNNNKIEFFNCTFINCIILFDYYKNKSKLFKTKKKLLLSDKDGIIYFNNCIFRKCTMYDDLTAYQYKNNVYYDNMRKIHARINIKLNNYEYIGEELINVKFK